MEAKNRVVLTLLDREGPTKEEFDLTADEAFAVSTFLHLLKRTSPRETASWQEACKIAMKE